MKKAKTDHRLATYQTSDDTWHVQLSSHSGESWGWEDGPFSSQREARARASVIADEEGYQFDE